ncbi:hypothetical protein Fmac_005537 [Flemingia macrophylla]|uniref:Uncharacterized protein n=1 Tax=Flemingia macrophylla TaxID=520843 RepID=A0ABD1N915_9FABA
MFQPNLQHRTFVNEMPIVQVELAMSHSICFWWLKGLLRSCQQAGRHRLIEHLGPFSRQQCEASRFQA